MNMRLHGNRWLLRMAGTLFGLGACVLGLLCLFGGGGYLPEIDRERVTGFGLTSIVVGGVAIAGSLLMRDVYGLWHCTPRRWRMFRGR